MKQPISALDNGSGGTLEKEKMGENVSGPPDRLTPVSTLRRGIDEGTDALPGPPRHDSRARLHHHQGGSRYEGRGRVSDKGEESPPSLGATVEVEQSPTRSPSAMRRTKNKKHSQHHTHSEARYQTHISEETKQEMQAPRQHAPCPTTNMVASNDTDETGAKQNMEKSKRKPLSSGSSHHQLNSPREMRHAKKKKQSHHHKHHRAGLSTQTPREESKQEIQPPRQEASFHDNNVVASNDTDNTGANKIMEKSERKADSSRSRHQSDMKAKASHSKHAAAAYSCGSSSGIAYYPSSDDEVDKTADLYNVDVDKTLEKKTKMHNQRYPRDTTHAYLSGFQGQDGDEDDIDKGLGLDNVNTNTYTDNVDSGTVDAAGATAQQKEGPSLSTAEQVEQDASNEAAAVPGGLVPGAVRVLGLDAHPFADMEGSDDEESRGRSTVVPEIEAEYVDREEERRRMREEIIQGAPYAEAQRDKWSLRTKRRLVLGGIAFVVLAIAVGVSLGMTLPSEEPAALSSPDLLEGLLSSV